MAQRAGGSGRPRLCWGKAGSLGLHPARGCPGSQGLSRHPRAISASRDCLCALSLPWQAAWVGGQGWVTVREGPRLPGVTQAMPTGGYPLSRCQPRSAGLLRGCPRVGTTHPGRAPSGSISPAPRAAAPAPSPPPAPGVPGRREAAAEPHRSHFAPPPPALAPGENPPPCLGGAAAAPLRSRRSAPARAALRGRRHSHAAARGAPARAEPGPAEPNRAGPGAAGPGAAAQSRRGTAREPPEDVGGGSGVRAAGAAPVPRVPRCPAQNRGLSPEVRDARSGG